MLGNKKINAAISSEDGVYYGDYIECTLLTGSTRTRTTKLAPYSLGRRGGKVRGKCWLLFFPILLLMVPGVAHAQAWSGILSSSRAINWSNAGIPGGIPNRATICATLNPGATASQINSAIASCPNGQVVFLNAGTYSLTGGIDFSGKSNVTLRGAGPEKTILVYGSGAAVGCEAQQVSVCLAGSSRAWVGNPGTVYNWTAGYSAGTTQITFSSVSGLSVGQLLILDQLNDNSDTGNVFINDTTTYGQEGGSPGRSGSPDRNQQQFVEITAISGTVVTISSPIYMPNWRSSQIPQAWSPGVIGSNVGTMIGVEALTVDTTNDGSAAMTNIEFGNCYACWVKNVKSLNANRNHIWLYQAARAEIRDSYFYGTKNAASQSYGVESFMTSDDLVINNIFQHITAPLMTGNNAGSVFAYNYGTDDYYNVITWMEQTGWTHDAGVGMVLFEGNEGNGLILDDIHGTADFVTLFRNQFTGIEPNKTAHTNPFENMAYNRYQNVIGNVLGTPGYHNTYQDVTPSGTNADTSIYLLGWSGNQGTTLGSVPNDSLVATSLMRWGNYDTVTGAAQWNASEVPSGLSQYANSVPSTRNLPASFVMSSKPSWWGTMPWPAIGPDVTGGSDLTGHAYLNPAQLCFNNTTKNSSGILNFNANNCYAQLTPPAPPTNLSGVVH